MRLISELNTYTKTTLGLGVLCLIYGFLSRIIPIYFLWEIKSIGFYLILFGIIGLLLYGLKKQKEKQKRTIWYKLAIGAVSIFLFVDVVASIIVPNTTPYKMSKEYILNNEDIKSEVGKISGFGFTYAGNIMVESDFNGQSGDADFSLIVKGNKKFKIVTVILKKDSGKDWEIIGIE